MRKSQLNSTQDEIDHFSLWEKQRKKPKINFVNEMNSKDLLQKCNDKEKSYTKKDQLRRAKIQLAKDELYMLMTGKKRRVNKIDAAIKEKKRQEFIYRKQILKAEMDMSGYKSA